MALISPQQANNLEAHGLKVYPGVSIGQLDPVKNGLDADSLGNYALLYKAPVIVWGNCILNSCVIGAYSYVNADSHLNLCRIGNYC